MMRVVWWSTALLVLLAAASALRTPQVEGLTRTSRRLPSPSAPDVNSVSNFNQPEAQPTFRSRNSRGRDETTPRDVVRTRTRNRPIEATSESAQSQENNERFDSRRTSSRSRSRPVEIEVKAEPIVARENVARGRFRQVSRRPPQVTQTTLETSSPTIDESKLEVINSNLDDISKIVPREEITSTTQFRRRSSATPTTEAIVPRGRRGRINTRTNTRPLDLDSSGTTNSISVSDKEPTTARTGDIRNARKLRFRTRPAESDANLTGEGLTKRNEAVKSSQRKEITSQSEAQTFAPIVERIVSQSTEANKLKTTTLKVTKVIRRPLSRRKPSIRSSGSPPKTKETEEISDDDNYPPSFKALIQSKNASTQASSPPIESLSVKASQKVYNTYTPSLQSTQTGPAENKYSRLRKQKDIQEEDIQERVDVKLDDVSTTPEETKPSIVDSSSRKTFVSRNRTVSSSSSNPYSNQKPIKVKFNRKVKVSTTETPNVESSTKSKDLEGRKSFVRPPNFSRKFSSINFAGSTEISVVTEKSKDNFDNIKRKPILPKTSYYSRLRKNLNKNITSPTESGNEPVVEPVQNKVEDTADMPLIFTLLKKSNDSFINSEQPKEVNTEGKNDVLITSNSKESQENNTINEVSIVAEDSESMAMGTAPPTISARMDSDRYKFHANYKDENPSSNESKQRVSTSITSSVRNIQTRKFGRKRVKSKNAVNVESSTTIPRDRNIRKYSESYSKTTEASNNGITSEPEKSKSRFSSKYRATVVDKPFYKPTVPTVTSSTAWLKFYVTDNLLTKSIEEPKWFIGEEIDVATKSVPRQNVMTSKRKHESSTERVNGII